MCRCEETLLRLGTCRKKFKTEEMVTVGMSEVNGGEVLADFRIEKTGSGRRATA